MPHEIAPEEAIIADHELLYRSVQLRNENFHRERDGMLRISSQAFADRSKEPSLYRHRLCAAPPQSNPPRLNSADAVAGLQASAIRGSGPLEHANTHYAIDVRSEPEDHPAHAVVFALPQFPNNSSFKRLKEALARIVQPDWPVPPDEGFVQNLPTR